MAPQSVLTALLLMAANVRKIRAFLQEAAARHVGERYARPRRRRTDSLQTWRPHSMQQPLDPAADPPLIA